MSKRLKCKNDTLIAEAKVFAKTSLMLIDQSKYNATWDQSSPTIQKLLTKEAWTKQLITVLQPLGELKSRTLKFASFHIQLLGTPNGQYVVIQFTSVFENKKILVESLKNLQTLSIKTLPEFFVSAFTA